MFELSAKNGFCDVILGSEEKTSDLAAHFSRNSGAANTVLLTIQTLMDDKIESTVFTRPHAMKRHKIILPMLRNGELKFRTPVNFEVEYFSTRN